MGTNFDYLWNATQDTRKAVLATPFIKGVDAGTLDPVAFGGYMVQDCIYVYEQYNYIKVAAKRATDKDLQTFLNGIAVKYEKYYKAAFKTWHIDPSNPSGIQLGPECQAYVDYVKKTAETMDTIYFLVAMSPCLSLWAWLGEQIGPKNHGVYTDWVKDNFRGGSTLQGVKDRINKNTGLDRKVALDVFKTGMGHECSFFGSIK